MEQLNVKSDTAKCYPLVFKFQDGCEFHTHGKNQEEGWNIFYPTGVIVTCPHGLQMEMGTGSDKDMLQYIEKT